MSKTNLLIDTGVFTAFLISSAPRMTGNQIHEWLGVALAAALIVHILLHWKWIVSVGIKFFKNLWQVSRLQFVVNSLIFVAFITLITSGLIISKDVLSIFGIQFEAGHAWKQIHSTASDAAVILTGIHIALHWSWIVCMMKKYVFQPVLTVFHPGLRTGPVLMNTSETK